MLHVTKRYRFGALVGFSNAWVTQRSWKVFTLRVHCGAGLLGPVRGQRDSLLDGEGNIERSWTIVPCCVLRAVIHASSKPNLAAYRGACAGCTSSQTRTRCGVGALVWRPCAWVGCVLVVRARSAVIWCGPVVYTADSTTTSRRVVEPRSGLACLTLAVVLADVTISAYRCVS